MRIIEDLMSPVGVTVFATQSARDATACIRAEGHALVLNLSHRPMGILTAEDIAELRSREPQNWVRRRCACLVQASTATLRPEQPVEGAVWLWREEGGRRPLLVFNGEDPVGVLHLEAVERWCRAYQPELLGELPPSLPGLFSSEVESAPG